MRRSACIKLVKNWAVKKQMRGDTVVDVVVLSVVEIAWVLLSAVSFSVAAWFSLLLREALLSASMDFACTSLLSIGAKAISVDREVTPASDRSAIKEHSTQATKRIATVFFCIGTVGC